MSWGLRARVVGYLILDPALGPNALLFCAHTFGLAFDIFTSSRAKPARNSPRNGTNTSVVVMAIARNTAILAHFVKNCEGHPLPVLGAMG
jgi:hypothetical protein